MPPLTVAGQVLDVIARADKLAMLVALVEAKKDADDDRQRRRARPGR